MGLFDLLAPIYNKIHPDPSGTVAAIRQLARPSAGDRLLDLGGGTGRVAQQFLHHVGEVIVVDASRGMLQQARGVEGLRALRGSADSLPFPDSSLDLVLCIDALHHFKDHDLALTEVLRVLKPDGRIIVQEFNRWTWAGKMTMFIEWLLRQGSKFYSPDELLEKAAGHGIKASLHNEKEARFYLLGTKPRQQG